MNEREQIITFLLQACDAKNRQVEELQKQLTEQQKLNAELQARLPKEPTN